MTWEELKIFIENMTDEQKNTDVTICISDDEFSMVKSLEFAEEEFCDVLDDGHPFLICL